MPQIFIHVFTFKGSISRVSKYRVLANPEVIFVHTTTLLVADQPTTSIFARKFLSCSKSSQIAQKGI
jgi:hypothetical protein